MEVRDKFIQKQVSEETEPSKMNFKSFIIKYLKEYEFPNNRITTAVKNEGICRNHIVPVLGDQRLCNI